MKLAATALIAISILMVSSQSMARDTKLMMSISDAMESATYKDRLDPDVALYFGDQKHAKVLKTHGTFPTNKKTNAFNKSEVEACEWVLLSALLSLQERARAEGGNAVINIASYYQKKTVSSDTEYECHDGVFIAGVALIGEIATLAD